MLRRGVQSGCKLRSRILNLRACPGLVSGSNPTPSSPAEAFVPNSSGRGSSRNWTALSTGAASLLFGTVLFSQPALSENDPSGSFFNKILGGPPPPSSSPPSDTFDVEKAVQEVREAVREKLKPFRGLPPLSIVSRGQQVVIRFPIPPACDIYQLIHDAVSRIGENERELSIRARSSAVSRELVIHDMPRKGELTSKVLIVVFEPLVGERSAEIEFLKEGRFAAKEIDTVVNALLLSAGIGLDPQQKAQRLRKAEATGKKGKRAIEALEKLGVKIYGLEDLNVNEGEALSWDTIAGYYEQKREIEDNVLLALKRPEVYDSIARGTRHKFESNRPRAVLFEGPPGTGKTSCARVIASQAGVPLLYVPLEVVTSKYYGESERLLSSVFNAGNDLPNGAIVFLDEIDALATTRDNEMHEATRRMLSVLLRQMDGFEQDKRIVVIAATNRKQDLDPALLSRFDASITFDLPDFQTREEIVAQYARHLTTEDLTAIAAASEGMSGRDLRDVCQQAERKWASKLIKGLVGNPPTHGLPPVQEYIESADKRRQSIVRWAEEQVRLPPPSKRKEVQCNA